MAERLKIYLGNPGGDRTVVEALKKISNNEILVKKPDGQNAILFLKTQELKNVPAGYLMNEGRKIKDYGIFY